MSYITIPTNNNLLTKQLISNIYSSIDITKFRYEIIQYENELHKLLKQKYYISVNFYGFSSLLVFTKIKDKFYSFTVDRQTLTYNFNKLDFSKIKIEDRRINLDDSIYKGTIFDGTIIKNKNNTDIFIISDVYTFCGNNYTKIPLNVKLMEIKEYLNKYYDQNDPSNIVLNINKVYDICEIDKLVNIIIPKTKLKCRGLTFYPEISENRLIFVNEKNNVLSNDDDKSKVIVHNKFNNRDDNKDDKNKENREVKYKYVNLSNEEVYAVLEMKPTPNIDVYKLCAVDKVEMNGKKVLKRIDMGIAFIRGIDNSLKIRKIMDNNNSVLMKCKFNDKLSKWEPIDKETNATIPSLLSKIEESLTLMEDE